MSAFLAVARKVFNETRGVEAMPIRSYIAAWSTLCVPVRVVNFAPETENRFCLF